MPEIKKTSKVFRSHNLMTLLFSIPLLGCFAYLYLMEGMHAVIHPVYVMIAAFPVLIAGLWLQNRRWTRFKCPDCGKLLERSLKLDGEPLTFHCEKCDIKWDTGFTDQMDST